MLTFGFYDSLNHDRRYTAIQMSSIFDGIIEDGIFMSIGDRFKVTPDSGMRIAVGTGRAWFNHTWTLNDSPLYLTVEKGEIAIDRLDSVVLEINRHPDVRANSIRILKGTEQSIPMEHSEYVDQYLLSLISVPANTTDIKQCRFYDRVGMNATPFVTGAVQSPFSIEDIVTSFESEWESWLWGYTNQCTNEYTRWRDRIYAEFREWLEYMDTILEGDAAVKLASEVEKLKRELDGYMRFRQDLLEEQTIYDILLDSNGEPILDSNGDALIGRVVFAIR